VAAVAAALVMTAAACGSVTSDAEARQVSGAVVREAAERTGQVTSGRTVVTTSFEGFDGVLAPQDGAEVTVDGSFDVAADRATVSVDLTEVAGVLGGGVGRLGAALLPGLFDEPSVAVVDGTELYLRSPVLELVDSPTPWVSTTLDGAVGNPAGGFADPLRLDRLDQARGFIAYLEGVGDEVTAAGGEQIDGVEATRYEGTIDLERLVAELPADEQARATEGLDAITVRQVPFVVWIDGAGLVRRVQFALEGVTLGDGSGGPGQGTVVVRADLLAPDQPVVIAVPPAEQVTPVESLDGPGSAVSPLLPDLGN
jgi:hypothetical protein